MPSITIRNVPNETRDELAARATAKGQSLQEYLLGKLNTMASTIDTDTWLEQMMSKPTPVDNPISTERIVEIIRHDRDSRS
ncbi:MAG: hypothetical protein WAS05_01400 [Candidatus Nanopelagicales bacterium]